MPKKNQHIRNLIIALAVAVIAGGAVLWHKVVREQFFPKNFGVVEAGEIYRSGQLTPQVLRRVCTERQIRTIIDLDGWEPERPEKRSEQRVADELGVKRYTFSMVGDGTGDPEGFAEVVRLMADPANQPVLVHCAAGAQRTSTAVILYRHLEQGEPIAEVYPESFRHKHKAGEWQLLAYLADHVDDIRAAYESSGTAGGRPADGQRGRGSEEKPPQHDQTARGPGPTQQAG
jgi:protein tyrosine/serine phosphatase